MSDIYRTRAQRGSCVHRYCCSSQQLVNMSSLPVRERLLMFGSLCTQRSMQLELRRRACALKSTPCPQLISSAMSIDTYRFVVKQFSKSRKITASTVRRCNGR